MDDQLTPIEGWARFRPPYFRIAAVTILAVAILGLGFFGPHPAGPPADTAAPTLPALLAAASPTAAPSGHGPATAPSAGGTGVPSGEVPAAIEDTAALTLVDPIAGGITGAWLAGPISSRSIAVVGQTLYYIVGGVRIQSTSVDAGGPGRNLVTASRCQGINQLAAAGHELAYVVTSPGGPSSTVANCGAAGRVSWSVWLLDLNGGRPRRVAQGVRDASIPDVATYPVHLAMSATAYAFNRPPFAAEAGSSDTVEVHAIDGRLLWKSRTQRPVADLMLGGGTLAILTEWLSNRDIFGRDAVTDLWTASAAHPNPAPIDVPAASASLSPDGLHLTWEKISAPAIPGAGPPGDVAIQTVRTGVKQPITMPTSITAPAPLRPAISTTGAGVIVAWLATEPNGAVRPAVRNAAGGKGVVLPSALDPVWLGISGGRLFWVGESANGWLTAAYSIELGTLGLG